MLENVFIYLIENDNMLSLNKAPGVDCVKKKTEKTAKR